MPVKAGIALRPATSPFAGARSRAMLLLHYKAKSFRLPSAAESLSLGVANGGVGRALPAGFPRIQNQERSIAFGDRVTFSLRGQRESNQRERPPRLALAGHPARQVREPGSGFSTAHRATAPALPQLGHPCPRHVLAKRHRHPADARCAACRPRLTAAQGPRVEQRAILARTIQKSGLLAPSRILVPVMPAKAGIALRPSCWPSKGAGK